MSTTTRSIATPAGYTIVIPRGRRPLYRQYPGQGSPQPAHLEIDTREGHAGAGWAVNPEIGDGVPAQVWHGLAVRVRCETWLSGAQMRALSRRIADDVDVVIDGTDRVWDGSNHVAVRGPDAHAALGRIARVLEDSGRGAGA